MEMILRLVKDTQKLAKDLVQEISATGNPSVIALYGDLGAGKTTFVQFFAKALGIKEKILSPTFVIIKTFEIRDANPRMRANDTNKHTNKKSLVHIDTYRLKSAKDLLALGLKDILKDQENIVVIEWPEKIEKYLPKNTKRIYFKTTGTTKRKITIT